MIAWKLTAAFDKQRHLFSGKVETGYIVEAYTCRCGHTDFVIKKPHQVVAYNCTTCENSIFYSADDAWGNLAKFIDQHRDVSLEFEHAIEGDEHNITASYITKIPRTIDFLSRKVILAKKSVYRLNIACDGTLEETYILRLKSSVSEQLSDKLMHYARKNCSFGIPDPRGKNLTLDALRFFLSNRHLQDFDLYYWDASESLEGVSIKIEDALEQVIGFRSEKSIKAALYKNYLKKMHYYGRFYFGLIQAFSKTVQDPNFVVRFLEVEFFLAPLLDKVDSNSFEILFHFLKIHYSEKQILNLFLHKKFASQIGLFHDAINELNYDRTIIERNFRKVTCQVETLHDEFVRCTKPERSMYMFHRRLTYSKEFINACTVVDDYEVRLPYTGAELNAWAEHLHNCMASYFEEIIYAKTAIYGFFLDQKLTFAVEVSDKKFVQGSGKYNLELTKLENLTLAKWFKQFFEKNLLTQNLT